MELDLSSFSKSVGSLEKTLNVAEDDSFVSGLNEDQKEAVKAGVIQNFEFTYEICWKFMKKWLGYNLGRTYITGISRRELFRLSAENELIDDIEKWMEYHQARNETLHTYDQDTADDVYEAAKEFLKDAKKLLAAIRARND